MAYEGSAQMILMILWIRRQILDFEVDGDVVGGIGEKVNKFIFENLPFHE